MIALDRCGAQIVLRTLVVATALYPALFRVRLLLPRQARAVGLGERPGGAGAPVPPAPGTLSFMRGGFPMKVHICS